MNHTLLSKQNWCENAPTSPHRNHKDKSWQEVAYLELDDFLLRKPWESTPASQHGINFEDAVYASARKPVEQLTGSTHFKDIVKKVKGAQYQKFYTKDMKLNDDVLIRWYGIFDVDFAKEIMDIKTTAKYKPNNYIGGTQDLLYTWLANKYNFTYLVAEWDKTGYPAIKDVHNHPVVCLDPEKAESKLKDYAEKFVAFLKQIGRYDLYVDCYSHDGKGWKSQISKDPTVLDAFYKKHWDNWKGKEIITANVHPEF